VKDYIISSKGFRLFEGDEVYWTDPDDDLCSDYFTIHAILDSNVVLLVDDSGNCRVEAFAHELS